MICPHCKKQHVNQMEQALCPMRPEQVPLMVAQFGTLGKGDYGVTDRIRYTANGQEHTGVILWIVAPGNSGSKVSPDEKLRYIVEREIPEPSPEEKLKLLKSIMDASRKGTINIHDAPRIFGNSLGFSDEYEEVYQAAVLGRK